MIVALHGWISLRGVHLDWRGPFEIWKVVNEGQQSFIGDNQRSELRGLPLFLRLVSGSLSIFSLSSTGLRQLLPLQLAFFQPACS